MTTSMFEWYDKTKELPIPQPKTELILCSRPEISALFKLLDGIQSDELTNLYKRIEEKANLFTYPIFLRTDLASGKHDWVDNCFVQNKKVLGDRIFGVFQFNVMVGIFPQGFAVRELLELDWKFKAFNGMPVAREFRLFVNDGNVECVHPYWPEDAIAKGYNRQELPHDWRHMVREMNELTDEERNILIGYAKLISEAVPGYLSVDFAYGKDEKWYFIDLANGDKSYHWCGCINNKSKENK